MRIIALTVTLWLSSLLNAKPFVMGNLEGQLGNQLFQIAAAVSLALDNDAEAVFPDLTESDKYDIPTNYHKVLFRLNGTRPQEPIEYYYTDIDSCYYKAIPYHPNMHIKWWFQSEKYFINHKDEILALFAPSEEITTYLQTKYADILKHPYTVAVHVRSYMREDPEQKFHLTYGVEYFEKAILQFPENALFVVCSNDLKWCEEAFAHIPRNIVFIEGEPSYHDLYLMSMCKHNIICNSSFSWWSAYLNRHPDKIVLAPPAWFAPTSGQDYRDVMPEGWVVLRL